MGAGGEGQAAHGHLQGALARLVQAAELAQELGGEVRVGVAALVLDQAGGFDEGSHLGRRDALLVGAHFLVRDGGDFDVQIDAVEQRHSRVVSPQKPQGHACG